MSELKEDFSPQKVMEAVNAMHEILQKKDADSTENKEKLSKIEKFLDAQEDITQKRLLEEKRREKIELDHQERLENIEKSMSRIARSSDKSIDFDYEIKAFNELVQRGPDKVSAEMVKYLRTDIKPDGGYLAPPQYVAEIIKSIVEISPVRSVARVRKTTQGAIEVPVRTVTPQAQWTGEGGQMTDTQPKYGLLKIPTSDLTAEVTITNRSLNDSAFDMQSEINVEITEQFAYSEGYAFLNGDGIAKPNGILSNSSVQAVNSGDAALLTSDSLITVAGELKTGYNPMYMFNRRTLAAIRKFKGADGHYIWTASLQEGAPGMINGEPYVVANDVPDIGAGTYPVIYGDFLRGYTIVDDIAMTMIRDPYTQGKFNKVVFYFTKGTGGQVVLPEAFKKILIAA